MCVKLRTLAAGTLYSDGKEEQSTTDTAGTGGGVWDTQPQFVVQLSMRNSS